MAHTDGEQDVRPAIERLAYGLYSRFILPLVANPLSRQRLKLLWFGWGYWRLLLPTAALRLRDRLSLLLDFVSIDWRVLHGHTPAEMTEIVVAASNRTTGPGGTFVEAGCWNGGSSIKFSLVCRRLRYRLDVYDSFQGVEDVSQIPGEWDYSGQYAATQASVQANLERYGAPELCTLWPGWFADTLAATGARAPVRIAYIDCDIAKGTSEALQGIVPALADNGVIFSQDYHIAPVARVLNDASTWARLGRPSPRISRLGRRLVAISWPLS